MRRWRLCWAGMLPGVLALACDAGDVPRPQVRFDLGSATLLDDVREIHLYGYLNPPGLSCDDRGGLVGMLPDSANVDIPITLRATFLADAGSWIFHVTAGDDFFPIDGPKRLAEGCAAASIAAGSSPHITIELHDLRREVYCGNGTLDPTSTPGSCPCPEVPPVPPATCACYFEECDNGPDVLTDNCGSDCQFLPDVCGDSRLDATETCDDGGTTSGDGCSNTCQTEPFQVNTNVAQTQSLPRIAAGLDGASNDGFAVVWADESGRTDSSPPGIVIAYYDDAGGRPGVRFEAGVNITPARQGGTQTSPAVGWGDGGFLVTYVDQSRPADWDVYSVAYDSSRARLRTPPEELVPSTAGAANDSQAVVGAHPAWDGFVVVWAKGPSPSRKIFARTFDGTGVAVSGDIQVQASGTVDEFLPAVAVASDGSFAVAWVQGSGSTSIQLARFPTFDALVGTVTQANSTPDVRTRSEPSMGFDSAGRLLVAWNDADEGSIRARLYPVAGTPADDFRISESALSAGLVEQGRLTTSVAASGVAFLVVWAAQGDGRVFGRLVTDANTFANNRVTATNGEFLISPDPDPPDPAIPQSPSRARVAITPSGMAMVVWQDTEGATLPAVDPPGGIWGRMFPVP